MKLLGTCDLQYANHLLSNKQLVLRADRDKGDKPQMNFYDLSSDKCLLMNICNDVKIEKMQTAPSKGAKDRADFYLFDFIKHSANCICRLCKRQS